MPRWRAERGAHRDRPLGLVELGDRSRKVPQPLAGPAGRRSVGHHVGNARVHFPRFAQAPPGYSCVTTATHRGCVLPARSACHIAGRAGQLTPPTTSRQRSSVMPSRGTAVTCNDAPQITNYNCRTCAVTATPRPDGADDYCYPSDTAKYSAVTKWVCLQFITCSFSWLLFQLARRLALAIPPKAGMSATAAAPVSLAFSRPTILSRVVQSPRYSSGRNYCPSTTPRCPGSGNTRPTGSRRDC